MGCCQPTGQKQELNVENYQSGKFLPQVRTEHRDKSAPPPRQNQLMNLSNILSSSPSKNITLKRSIFYPTSPFSRSTIIHSQSISNSVSPVKRNTRFSPINTNINNFQSNERHVTDQSYTSVNFQSIKQQLTPKKFQQIKPFQVSNSQNGRAKEQIYQPRRVECHSPSKSPVSVDNEHEIESLCANVTFNAGKYVQPYEQPNPKSCNPVKPTLNLNQLVTKLGQSKQLFRATSNALSSIRSEKINSEEEQTMKDLFHQLEKSGFDKNDLENTLSLLVDTSSIQNSLQMSQRTELTQMYEKMATQLGLLNSLISCLEHRLSQQDKENVKCELKEFALKIKEFGQKIQKQNYKEEQSKENKSRIRSQKDSKVNQTSGKRSDVELIKQIINYRNLKVLHLPLPKIKKLLNNNQGNCFKSLEFQCNRLNHHLGRKNEIDQIYRNIYLTGQDSKKEIYFYQVQQKKETSSQSTVVQSEEQTSLQSNKMQQNKQKIDVMINKLQSINESYRRISDCSSKCSDDLEVEKDKLFKLQNERRKQFLEFLGKHEL